MAKRVIIGDIIEIPTTKGLAYAQYTHKDELMGALLRVLPNFYQVRLPDFQNIVSEPTKFHIFFPLQAAVNRKIFEVVANVDLSEQEKTFPLFRAAGHITREGKVSDWWLWDGSGSWRVPHLTPDQQNLPIKEIWNDTLLVERLEQGWTPKDDPHVKDR